MKSIKIALSTLCVATLAVVFSACGSPANTSVNNSAANKANNAVIVTNATPANVNNSNPANTDSSAKTAESSADNGRFQGDYMVGDVKCTVTPDKLDLMHEVKCAGKEKAQTYSRDDAPPKAMIVSSDNEKVRFVFDNAENLASGNYTDETGKTVKVTRVK